MNPHGFCERKLFVEDPDGCVTDLYSYVYWYTVLKPFYEIGLQAQRRLPGALWHAQKSHRYAHI